MRLAFVATFLLALAASPLAQAQQLAHQVQNRSYTNAYFMSWRDVTGTIKKIEFNLPRDMVAQSLHEFKPLDQAAVNNHVYNTARKATGIKRNDGLRLDVARAPNGIQLTVAGRVRNEAQLQKGLDDMNLLMETARKNYIEEHLFRFVDDKTVMPDHAKVAKMYYGRMAPIAREIERQVGRDSRQVINYLLGMMQTIPYDTLLSESARSNGSGFATPVELLHNNLGDCDSKSVAMMSILRNLFPSMRMVMIYIPEHTFVGFQLPHTSKDFALKIQGSTFVLAEPVGPRLMPLGQLDEKSLAKLRKGDFTYVEMPFN